MLTTWVPSSRVSVLPSIVSAGTRVGEISRRTVQRPFRGSTGSAPRVDYAVSYIDIDGTPIA
jgi:hypothetical protein